MSALPINHCSRSGAIGRCLAGKPRLVSFEQAKPELTRLLKEFGPPRQNTRPQEPFWRLRKDHVWDIPRHETVPEHKNGSVASTTLVRMKIAGGLSSPIYDHFRENPVTALQLADHLVSQHFPETLQQPVLNATLGQGFHTRTTGDVDLSSATDNSDFLVSLRRRRRRDASFRHRILSTYGYSCLVCAFSLECPPDHWPALEAAHIKWHCYNGPNTVSNGLCLCIFHHELFDWGVFTISPDTFHVIIADELLDVDHATFNFSEWHERPLTFVRGHNPHRPAAEFLQWHNDNVFRGA